MILDQRLIYFQKVQANLSVIAVPFQYVVNAPIQMVSRISQSITTQQRLLEENARLRAQHLMLQAKLQRVLALESENAQLRALLQSSPHVGGKYTIAQLLAVSMDPTVQKVVLDKGTHDRVYVGQPVLDAYGVIGQVVSVGPATSQVMLITDTKSAIPVQNSRNGVRAIAGGTGTGTLQLLNAPDNTDIQRGDILITSGLDQRFPPGYPVGVVKSVMHDQEMRFATITVLPSAHLDRSRQVLLVWPEATASLTPPPLADTTTEPAPKPLVPPGTTSQQTAAPTSGEVEQ